MSNKLRALFFPLMVAFMATVSLWAGPDWDQIQDIKAELLGQTASHAMEQQRISASTPIDISLDGSFTTAGHLEASQCSKGGLEITVAAQPSSRENPPPEVLEISLPEPLNMANEYSGLAMTIRTVEETSPEVRWGVRLVGANGQVAEILPKVPLLSNWNESVHEVYLDWAFIDYADVDAAIAVLKSVVALEFTVAAERRSNEFGPSSEPQPAHFFLSNLRLVDYLMGSFDPNRSTCCWDSAGKKDLTLQHRVQEVTGIVARFGGEKGLASALASLDMATRTQCWDGSFLDGRRGANTVVSGEYTHGFTLWGLLDGYAYLEKIHYPALDDTITIGTDTMSRRDFYQRMIYRAALSRSSSLPSRYRDDIIHSNTLVYGANRVLGYAVAMRRAADYLLDETRRQTVLDLYHPIIEEIAAAQGAYSGGFPILGEGDRYHGKGIHYDAGYTRTHMDWLVMGIKATGDPVLVRMLDRYQAVISAAMDARGLGIMTLLSERGHGSGGGSVELIIPDATAQVGLKYHLPIMAQWGYNDGTEAWSRYEPGARVNHFTNRAHVRGYTLGAHSSPLLFDLDPVPVPVDTGYRFPRQFPVWSSRFYRKEDGALVRTSTIRIDPDGTSHDDFRIEVGEYLVTVGVPVWITSPGGSVTAEAVGLEGWPTLLDDNARLYWIFNGTRLTGKVNEPCRVTLSDTGPVEFTVMGPELTLPEVAGGKRDTFRTTFILTPETAGQELTLTLCNKIPPYQR